MEGLDALFDAIDGGATQENEKEEEKKESSAQNENVEGKESEEKEDKELKEKENLEKDNDIRITAGEILEHTSLLTNVVVSSSNINKESEVKVKEEEGKEGKDDRAVASGTSHDKSIRSYSAYPDGWERKNEEKEEGEETKKYEFELDPFQKSAISFIKKNESVLVAAHTSAGKTAVAEYAIARSLKNNERVLYTSPIKALSNQKYRDFQEEFEDVGLMTGDITINPSATCLIMTTEILRSMLYRGSEIIREVAWVIFDEVHYMRDKERGVVWEESIILLPHKVKFVFLSATIPNAEQFVEWIVKIHHQPCHVVYTNYRPVPLQHYIFPLNGDGLHLVVDERGKFREANFQKAMAALQSSNVDSSIGDALLSTGGSKKKRKHRSVTKGDQTDLQRIVKLVMERNLDPVIIFSFSKKDCERYALLLVREDFTSDVEKELIQQVYTNAIESLGDDDRKLPQVEALLPLLKKGIGIHHGGFLPILKEIVEILFSEGLVKVLFATETFAIGVNMPAKTVIFTNCRKWDGKDFRWVTSGEYIQMSGRAGRRGKDDRGVVIQMLDEKMEPKVCKDILYGDPDPLNSSYRISYNMLLNMIRVEDVDPEYLLRASFHQFQQESAFPALLEQAREKEELIKKVPSNDNEPLIGEYFSLRQQYEKTQLKMLQFIQKPEYLVPFLQPGRLMDITIQHENFGWGALVIYKRRTGMLTGGNAAQIASLAKKKPIHTIDVILPCVDRNIQNKEDDPNKWRGNFQKCKPVSKDKLDDESVEWRIFSIEFESIQRVSAARIFIPSEQITSTNNRKLVGHHVIEVQRRFKDKYPTTGLPILDPENDMNIISDSYSNFFLKATALADRIKNHFFVTKFTQQEQNQLLENFSKKHYLRECITLLKKEARQCQSMVMKDELKNMKRVLLKLGHISSNVVIQVKGRTACEINTVNELVVVELVFSGVFNELSVEQSMALLSCLTFDDRVPDDTKANPTKGLKSFLANPFFKLQEVYKNVLKTQKECNIEFLQNMDEDEYVLEKLNPGIMEAIFAWCKGVKFFEIQKLAPTFEGNTIRCIRRLEELVRQIASASKAIGNHELQAKFEKGSELLKRDIVFCSSLYL